MSEVSMISLDIAKNVFMRMASMQKGISCSAAIRIQSN